MLRARMPEQGGWSLGELRAVTGEPLKLRLTSNDVIHGFAVGQLDFPAVDLHPGEVVEVSLTFERPGKYTFYCTRWCGADHWRMRGTIEVVGAGAAPPETTEAGEPPLYAQLGLDIDAPHPAQVTPASRPEAAHGLPDLDLLPGKYRTSRYYRTNSPAQAWLDLRAEPVTQTYDDEQLWSLVAALWQSNTAPSTLSTGKALYNQNCAACHGEQGAGDGVFAEQATLDPGTMRMDGHGLQTPSVFTDPASMLGASPALLHGKILRGGMGTGMPYWGPVFTGDQIWALVDYLWTFQFEYDLEVNP